MRGGVLNICHLNTIMATESAFEQVPPGTPWTEWSPWLTVFPLSDKGVGWLKRKLAHSEIRSNQKIQKLFSA